MSLIAIGSDHAAFEFKEEIRAYLTKKGYELKDFGTYSKARVDYCDYGVTVAESVAKGECEKGLVFCGTGVGISISANKVKGIRAAMAFNEFTACRGRQHNDANILCLGSENDQSQLPEMVKAFLTCEFEGGRHTERVEMLKKIENKR